MTEAGFEAANHGVQVFGGHGFIQEWGMEQIVRDAASPCCMKARPVFRPWTLIGRKVLGSGGKLLGLHAMIDDFC